VAGAARLGAAADTPHLIAFDMGGTTAKASLVEDGRLSLTTEYEFREGLSTSSRFIKAGGYMLKVPAIDIAEVGAGAGSIAGIDDGGLLRVGPESAGADPGPACYGQGGRRPTVTDANVVLGFLNPSYLAGGELPLRADLAVDAIRTHVAEPLGLSVREAAHGIREIANASMARAIRSVTIERGRDPRDFTLVAFGGSGPVHAVDVARALDIRRVLVPVSPGVFTAVGMLASDVEHHFVRAAGGLLAGRPLGPVNARLDEMVADALATLAREGYSREQVRLQAQADLRYAGQSSELVLPLAAPRLAPEDLPALTEAFAREYARTYGFATGEALALVNVRLVATGVRPHRLDFRSLRVAAGAAPGSTAPRKIAFDRRGPAVETPVLAREALPAAGMAGPLIVEGYDSTVVVPPGARIRRDAHDALSITLGPGSRGDAA
jgi:N-methylhydantoinase A